MEMTEFSGWNRLFVVVALVVLVTLFYFTAAAHFNYTTDDSYIYFQYAKNLAGGDGLSFNAGTPGYGFTSPLWLFMMASGGAAGADIPMVSKILDLVFASMSIMLLFFLSLELTRDVAVSFCATLAFSVNAWLLRWAGSGLETSLAVFLLLAFFRYLLRNEYYVASGVLGLLTLVRPEAALLMLPLILDLRFNSVNRSLALRTGVRMVSVWLVIVLPWVFTAYAFFGTIVPTTFGAKHAALFSPGEMAGSALDVVKTLGSADGVSILCLFVSLFIFAVRHRSRRAKEGGGDNLPLPVYHFRQSLVGVIWILLLPLFYIFFSVNVVSRYLLLVTPVALILGFFYLHELLLERSPVVRYGLVLALTVFIMVQNQVVYKKSVIPHLDSFTVGMETCLEPIGTWLKEQTSPGTVIMASDVGALGYFSNRFICDYNGIVSPGSPGSPEGRKDNDTFTEFLRAKRWGELCEPSYIVHRSFIPEELKDVSGLIPVMSKPFPGLSISDNRTVYYSVYRVGYPPTDKLLTGR